MDKTSTWLVRTASLIVIIFGITYFSKQYIAGREDYYESLELYEEEEKYISENEMILKRMSTISIRIEQLKELGTALKDPNRFQQAIDLTYIAKDLSDYGVCLENKFIQKIKFAIGKSQCAREIGIDPIDSSYLY